MNFGDINAKEHNSIGVYSKKVLIYGWDADALAPVRIVVDSNGKLLSANPTADYKISDEDVVGTDSYTGFLRGDGAWYIMKSSESGDAVAYRYASGSSSYTTNWANKTTLSYNLFSTAF